MNGYFDLFPNQIQNRTRRNRTISDTKIFELIELIKNSESIVGKKVMELLNEISDFSINLLPHVVAELESHRFLVIVPELIPTEDYFERTRDHFVMVKDSVIDWLRSLLTRIDNLFQLLGLSSLLNFARINDPVRMENVHAFLFPGRGRTPEFL